MTLLNRADAPTRDGSNTGASTMAPAPRLVQRKCACGGTPGIDGECAECRRKRLQAGARKTAQAKLVVGAPRDRFEREADRLAELAVRGDPSVSPTDRPSRVPAGGAAGLELDRHGSADVESVARGGAPLEAGIRDHFGARIGHDFGGVRIRSDSEAGTVARRLGARAFTVGRTIAFGPGEYAPASQEGRRLLAHELVHVAQQGAAPPMGQESGPKPAAAPVVQRAMNLGTVDEQRATGNPLPYREATEFADCIRIMGEGSAEYCRQEVLGEAPQPPSYVDVAGISTPVPWEFDVDTRRGRGASGRIGGVDVRILPDTTTRARKMRNRAKTNFQLNRYSIRARPGRDGNIRSFTGPGTVTLTIQTVYGPGVSAASLSGYGRGTTGEDVTAGETTLGFHEGHHGMDAIEFVRNHPFPVFTGAVGMSVADFRTAMQTYQTEREQWHADLVRHSLHETDCVGTTIDEHNRANGEITAECAAAP